MKRLLNLLSRRRHPYEPLIKVEISAGRLIHNLNEFRKIAPNGQIAPVLKSNAYGHGLIEVARVLEKEAGIPFFVVDSFFEALSVRSSGIRKPLLIIGYTPPDTMLRARLKDISFAVTTIATLRALCATRSASGQLKIHLKIDTGMHRQGILPEECTEAIGLIKDSPIGLEGICSHLSDADNADAAFTRTQIASWKDIAQRFRSVFASLKYIHLSNTDGHRFSSEIEANVSRLGLGLYGLADAGSFKPALDLQPVLEMKTIVTGVKKLNKGETVGYSNSFTAMNDMAIATIPAGYYEGVDRRLSNKGFVLVGPDRIPCRIVGRVSMNITSIDVSSVGGAEAGTPVIVISGNPDDPNSIRSIAAADSAIPYEIAVHIPAHLKRIIV